jgi:SAM-dependent methyltransferase
MFRRIVSAIIPSSARRKLRDAVIATALTSYEREVVSHLRDGFMPRECPLCGFKGGFSGMGIYPRYDAICPSCGSLERHRLMALYFAKNETAVSENTPVLHFAPEAQITKLLKSKTRNYMSADLMPGRAGRVLNIEHIDLPDRSIDLVICSHVLQHVDDRKALAELFRVLRPSGTALLSVPMNGRMPKTHEIGQTGPNHYGDIHLRFYGLDFMSLVETSGFALEEFVAVDPDIDRYGLVRGEPLFVARKP